ncbi:hypothetical protein NNO_0057 [Hydrogenimonas sp.]|nr:hypothetical protein NNO_0057 [Hydrogenimonas sp.]
MYGNITDKWNHILRKIDPAKKVATFEHIYQVKGSMTRISKSTI